LLQDGDPVPDQIHFSSFSPDERLVISGNSGVVRLQDPRTLAVVGQLQGGAAAFSPDGRWLAVARFNEIDVYDARTLGAGGTSTPVNTLRGSPANVSDLAFSFDSTRLATASADAVRIWSDIAGRQRGMTEEGSEFGTLLTNVGWDDLSLSDARADPALVRAAEQAGCPQERRDEDSSAMRRLFSGDGRVCVLDVQTRRVIAVIPVASDGWIVAALSPNGETLVTQPTSGSLQWLALPSGETIATLGVDLDTTPSVSFSPDGSQIVAITDGTVQVWRDNARRPIWTSRFETRLRRALFTPNGSRLVLGQNNGAVLVYDAQTFDRISSFAGRWYATPSFSLDGTRMFIGTEVWDTTTGIRLADLRGYADEYNRLSLDQNFLVAMNLTGHFTGYLWDVSRLTQPWDELARDACNLLLGPAGRKFRAGDVTADPLLRDYWGRDRDVCEGVEGVPSIEAVRRAAGLPAVAPPDVLEGLE
jgi:WD40 repeat protein